MSSSAVLLTAAPIAPLQQQLNGPNLLRQQLIDVLYSNGALRKKTPTDIVNVGLSLIPKLIAREDYDSLKLDCAAFNRDIATLYNTASLGEFFESYGGGDGLVRILLDILKQSQQLGRADECKPTGVIIRNDFMYDALSERFLQVEFNHIACGLGQLTSRIKNSLQLFHQSYLLHSEAAAAAASPPPSQPVFVPTSNSAKQIEMFTELFRLYGNPSAAFVEVMLDNEPNIFDSIPNETMLSQSGISVLRLLFSDIRQQNFRLDDATKKLYVHGREVAVVYFRSMYDPSHFSDGDKTAFWVAAERSTALLLPDVRSFLLGIKLTQHLLSSPALLSRHNLTSLLSSRFASHYCDTKHITTDYGDDVAAFLSYAKANKPNLLLKSLQEGGMGLVLGDGACLLFIPPLSLSHTHTHSHTHTLSLIHPHCKYHYRCDD
jgi:hypothetical protein